MDTVKGPSEPARRAARALLSGLSALVMMAAIGCGEPRANPTPEPAASTASAASAAAAEVTAAATSEVAPSGLASADAAPSALPSASATATAVAAASGAAGAKSASASPDPVPSVSATASAAATVAATAEPAPALTVQSDKVQGDNFGVWMQTAKSYKAGQAGSVEVVVVPKGDFHCNDGYPYKVKLGAAPAGVSYPQDIVRGASISAARTSIRVPFTAGAAGTPRISGRFYFSVCRADQCVIDNREVAATIKVE